MLLLLERLEHLNDDIFMTEFLGKNNLHNQLQVELHELRCKQLQNRLQTLTKANQLSSGRWDNHSFCKHNVRHHMYLIVIKKWKDGISEEKLFIVKVISWNNYVQKR